MVSVIINNCAGCDRRFRSLYEGIQTISIWEVLDNIPALPLPTYDGLQLSVHDLLFFSQKTAGARRGAESIGQNAHRDHRKPVFGREVGLLRG